MGCAISKHVVPEILESKNTKKVLENLVNSAEDWKIDWIAFTDSIEKTQINALHWAQDDLGNISNAIVMTLQNIYMHSTELFIISHGFLEAMDEYIRTLYILLSDQRIAHSDIKKKIELSQKLRKLRQYGKVAPEELPSKGDRNPKTENQIFQIRKRLEKIEASEKSRGAEVWELVEKNLKPAYKTTFRKYFEVWQFFETMFSEMLMLAEDLNSVVTDEAIGSVAFKQQKLQRDMSSNLLKEWTRHAQNLAFAWKDLNEAEANHARDVYNWITGLSREYQKTNSELITITRSMHLRHAELGSTDLMSSDLQNYNIKAILQEQVQLLGRINSRDKLTSAGLVNLMRMKQTARKDMFEKAQKAWKAEIIGDFRFKIEELVLYEKKLWTAFVQEAKKRVADYFSIIAKFASTPPPETDQNTGSNSNNSKQRRQSVASVDFFNLLPNNSFTNKNNRPLLRSATVSSSNRGGSIPSISVYPSNEDIDMTQSTTFPEEVAPRLSKKKLKPLRQLTAKPPPPPPKVI